MPNTLTNVKDIKVAQNALQPFMAALLPMRAFSTNFSPEPADKLDTVRVPVVGAPSPSSDFAGSYTTNADAHDRRRAGAAQPAQVQDRPRHGARGRARPRSTCSKRSSPAR